MVNSYTMLFDKLAVENIKENTGVKTIAYPIL
jgi:hypothetical protein